MSSRGSLLLTKDNEHWYREYAEGDNGYVRVYLEISTGSIAKLALDGDMLEIALKGDSELAMLLKATKFKEKL